MKDYLLGSPNLLPECSGRPLDLAVFTIHRSSQYSAAPTLTAVITSASRVNHSHYIFALKFSRNDWYCFRGIHIGKRELSDQDKAGVLWAR